MTLPVIPVRRLLSLPACEPLPKGYRVVNSFQVPVSRKFFHRNTIFSLQAFSALNLTIINVLTIFVSNNLSSTRRSHETPVCDTPDGQLGTVGRPTFGRESIARASRGLHSREKSRGCGGPRLPSARSRRRANDRRDRTAPARHRFFRGHDCGGRRRSAAQPLSRGNEVDQTTPAGNDDRGRRLDVHRGAAEDHGREPTTRLRYRWSVWR